MAAPVRPILLLNFYSKTLFNRLSRPVLLCHPRLSVSTSGSHQSEPQPAGQDDDLSSEVEEFRVYEIPGLKKMEDVKRKKPKRRAVMPPRYLKMPVDQDWTKVWPAAASFKYSVVPFPVRQGYIKSSDENEGVTPDKYANAELMKIPNFLHLTPAHVKKHCAALQKFCTEWPENLDSDDKIEQHFPVTVTNYTYCYSGSSIRHPKSRVVKKTFKLDSLNLDYHAQDKFIRLVGDRYDDKTGIVTIEADRCPVRIQNYEYINYLITALYFESQKTESWELQKDESDWERLYWDQSKSCETLLDNLRHNSKASPESTNSDKVLSKITDNAADGDIKSIPEVQQYKDSICEMCDEGEDSVTIQNYKDSVLNLYGLKKF